MFWESDDAVANSRKSVFTAVHHSAMTTITQASAAVMTAMVPVQRMRTMNAETARKMKAPLKSENSPPKPDKTSIRNTAIMKFLPCPVARTVENTMVIARILKWAAASKGWSSAGTILAAIPQIVANASPPT